MTAFDKIIGYDSIKNKLIKICDMLKNKECYIALGAKPISGVLLYGEPGLGKTLHRRKRFAKLYNSTRQK